MIITPPDAHSPIISIVMPVFNNSRYLENAVLSAAGQSYPNTEVVLHDDGSTDPEVGRILSRFQGHPRVKLSRRIAHEGISMATNRAILQSVGEYVAFLDCDDMLPTRAIETAVRYINSNPRAHYFYSSREEIDENGAFLHRRDFSKFSGMSPADKLLEYMFASHLKIIKKEAFYEVGLLKKEFDSCQDYDLALRMSRHFSFCHIPEYLYRYRIHQGQISKVKRREQALLAYRARDVEVLRRRIFKGDIGARKISIVMLTMNRCQRSRATLSQLANSTSLPYDLIVLDNGSSDQTPQFLRWFAGQNRNVRLFLEKENLGCAGGRKKALAAAQGDYVVMLDNDITVTPWWLENLMVRLVESGAHAACCRVVLPDGRIQYNGGSFRTDGPFVLFSFMDSRMPNEELAAMVDRRCNWLPGGATIYQRSVFDRVGLCEDLRGGLEDNDLSLQMGRAGLKMVNCPAARVIHHHHGYESGEMKDPAYSSIRYDREAMVRSVTAFYRRNGLIPYDPRAFKNLGIPHGSREETIAFFSGKADPAGRETGGSENAPASTPGIGVGGPGLDPGAAGQIPPGEIQPPDPKTGCRNPSAGNPGITGAEERKTAGQPRQEQWTHPHIEVGGQAGRKTRLVRNAPSGWGLIIREI